MNGRKKLWCKVPYGFGFITHAAFLGFLANAHAQLNRTDKSIWGSPQVICDVRINRGWPMMAEEGGKFWCEVPFAMQIHKN